MPKIEMTLGASNIVHCFPSHNDDVDLTRNKLSSSTATVTVLCLIQLELCDRPEAGRGGLRTLGVAWHSRARSTRKVSRASQSSFTCLWTSLRLHSNPPASLRSPPTVPYRCLYLHITCTTVNAHILSSCSNLVRLKLSDWIALSETCSAL